MSVENIHIEFCKEMELLCQPLGIFDINYFHFVRAYKDGSRISLSNNKAFSEYYYDKQYYLQPAIKKIFGENKISYRLWLSFNGNTIFQDLHNLFDIANGITITKIHVDYSDFYYFASRPENIEINNFYLVKKELLERFIVYFTNSAATFIKRAEKKRIYIPTSPNIITTASLAPPIFNNINLINDFIKKTPIKKFRIHDGIQESSISPREMDCILGILAGKTAKEISREHNLSVRTVENYINNIKVKFGCYKKNQLIEKLKSFYISGC